MNASDPCRGCGCRVAHRRPEALAARQRTRARRPHQGLRGRTACTRARYALPGRKTRPSAGSCRVNAGTYASVVDACLEVAADVSGASATSRRSTGEGTISPSGQQRHPRIVGVTASRPPSNRRDLSVLAAQPAPWGGRRCHVARVAEKHHAHRETRAPRDVSARIWFSAVSNSHRLTTGSERAPDERRARFAEAS